MYSVFKYVCGTPKALCSPIKRHYPLKGHTYLYYTELEIISPIFLTFPFEVFLLLGLYLKSGAHRLCQH